MSEEQLILAGCLYAVAGAMLLLADSDDEEEQQDVNYKKKSECVKSMELRSNQKSSFNLLYEELRLKDKDVFRQYLRMDEKCFEKILEYVQDKLIKQNTVMKDAIPPHETLSVVLRFLATGESYRSLADQTGLSLTFLSLAIPKVCGIIYDAMMKDYFKFPSTYDDWKSVANNFDQHWQFPLCVGALATKHIPLRAPKIESKYYNRNEFNSIILLALADAQYKFTYVEVGFVGSMSDGEVLNVSSLRHIISNADKYLPRDEIIGNNRCLPYTIVGNEAFCLEKHIMKPFPFTSDEKKLNFNFRLSYARQTVEHALIMLTNRFTVLQSQINLKEEKVVQLVQAACVLHNFLITHCPEYVDPITKVPSTLQDNSSSSSSSKEAIETRNQFCEYFSEEGAMLC